MNLILFDEPVTSLLLPHSDRRVAHLVEVLRRRAGESFDAGVINGPRGRGTLSALTFEGASLTFSWDLETPALDPITLVIGLPRPQSARTLLREVSSLGISAVHFILCEKSDPNYLSSSLWQTGEWRRHLISGAEQAFCTRLPSVTFGQTLSFTLAQFDDPKHTLLALDNYEAPVALSKIPSPVSNVVLAVGPERGWSAHDRDLLRNSRFTLAHLGARVLRTETACIVALAVIKAKMGLL